MCYVAPRIVDTKAHVLHFCNAFLNFFQEEIIFAFKNPQKCPPICLKEKAPLCLLLPWKGIPSYFVLNTHKAPISFSIGHTLIWWTTRGIPALGGLMKPTKIFWCDINASMYLMVRSHRFIDVASETIACNKGYSLLLVRGLLVKC